MNINQIKQGLLELSLTQKQLAEKIKVNPTYLNSVLSEYYPLSKKLNYKIEQFFENNKKFVSIKDKIKQNPPKRVDKEEPKTKGLHEVIYEICKELETTYGTISIEEDFRINNKKCEFFIRLYKDGE